MSVFSPLIYELIGIAMSVHNELGNQHPEYVYHGAMNVSLSKGNWEFDDEPVLDIVFRGEVIAQYRPDGLVKKGAEIVILEYKARRELKESHANQLIRYLNSYHPSVGEVVKGLLLNFGSERLTWKVLGE
ncbi:MAG: GxxExxY protein [Anaerolineales bacterium]